MTVELLNMDCMDYMAGLSDNAFDLACTDPPYGIGFDGHDQIIGKKGIQRGFSRKKLYGKKTWDVSPGNDYFKALKRISCNQIVWGGNYFINNLSISKGWIYWHKNPNAKNLTFSDGELAWSSFDKPLRAFFYDWLGFGMLNSGEKKIHPTQKPVALYTWIFQNYASKGQTVIDTHLGSCSSAIAAHYAGLDFVGCEIDEDYYKAGCKRFKEETRQLKLF